MAWNSYISLGIIDAPNLPGRSFSVNTKDSCAVLYNETILTTSWESSSPSEGGITSFVTSDTNHVVPFIVTFLDDGTYSSKVNLYNVSATVTSYPSGIYNPDPITFTSNVQPPDIREGYYQDWAFAQTSNVYNTNIPIICMSDSTYNSIENYVTNHVSAWLDGSEDFWVYFDELVTNNNAFWVNVDLTITTEPEGAEFIIYNTGQRGTWTVGDVVSDVSTPFYRWARVKLASTDNVDGRLAFYRQGLDDDIIKLIPKFTASIVACEYSTDGGANWQTSETFPFEYIYGSRIDELGTFIYATREGVNSTSSVPIFETEEEAEDWVNHSDDVDISDAINYEEVAERYGITNKTGTDITATDFGTASNFRSHFTQQYILDRAEVSIVAEALYDTGSGGFWEQIKEGIEMFGENPINSVCGLIYYPIDLTTVFTRLTPQTYIYFGGYMFPPTGSSTSLSVYKLNGYDGYIDIGTFTIEPAFQQNDYRNWEPYCSLSLYLPFIGMQKVSYNKYLNKTIKIRYYIDITNGSCLCILMADNKMMDYFNGSMGIQIPITLTDFSGYAQAQIRNLSNMAGVGSNIGEAALSGASGDVGGVISAGASAIGGFEKSMFAVSTTNINQFNTTKGSSGPMGNQYLPQKVYAIFEYIKTETTENLNQLEGTPSNASGNLGSFAGYLEADSIMLRTSAGMSESEKAEFINLVQSGIYI